MHRFNRFAPISRNYYDRFCSRPRRSDSAGRPGSPRSRTLSPTISSGCHAGKSGGHSSFPITQITSVPADMFRAFLPFLLAERGYLWAGSGPVVDGWTRPRRPGSSRRSFPCAEACTRPVRKNRSLSRTTHGTSPGPPRPEAGLRRPGRGSVGQNNGPLHCVIRPSAMRVWLEVPLGGVMARGGRVLSAGSWTLRRAGRAAVSGSPPGCRRGGAAGPVRSLPRWPPRLRRLPGRVSSTSASA